MIKIAVSGKLGSGKDLFLENARKLYPELDFHNEKFASPIYNIVNDIQEKLCIPRVKDGKVLQFIGLHYREIYPDIWVNAFFNNVHSSNRNVIITDVRFENELEECKSRGFFTIRILRQEELRLNNLGNRDLNHESEIALDEVPLSEYDYVINNNGSLEMFEGAISHIINEIRRKKK